jgi:hypothetical protein
MLLPATNFSSTCELCLHLTGTFQVKLSCCDYFLEILRWDPYPEEKSRRPPQPMAFIIHAHS